MEVRQRAGLDDNDFARATSIARVCLGADGVVLDPALAGPAYLRRRWSGGYQIAIRPDSPDLRFSIAHELGHWAVRHMAKWPMTIVREEAAANYLAAAILAPATTVRRAHRLYGERLAWMAGRFGLSQTAMSLRLAEVLGDERAVVTGTGNVLARGACWQALPTVEIARGLVRAPAIARRRLHGGIDAGRVALRSR